MSIFLETSLFTFKMRFGILVSDHVSLLKIVGRTVVFIILFLTHSLIVSGQYEISGTIEFQEGTFRNKVFLAIVEPNKPFWNVSRKQIINSGIINEGGFFSIKGNNLPEEESILRLYLVTGDSEVEFRSMPKNYVVLIANNQSNIEISSNDFGRSLDSYSFSGDFQKENYKILELEKSLLDGHKMISSDHYYSPKSEELLRSKRTKRIHNFCLNNDSPLTSIFALHNINLEDNYLENALFYDELLTKLLRQKNPSRYILELERQINRIKNDGVDVRLNEKNNYEVNYLLVLVLVLLTSYIIFLRVTKKKLESKIANADLSDSISLLTQREREIVNLAMKNLQNKEIADQLNIEVSTVKTHLSAAYKKLQVNNRAQLKRLLSSSLKSTSA